MVGHTKYVALVVQDNALIQKLVKVMLNKHGFETIAVENGKEALDMFNAGKSLDVVFMDMIMPIMDGIQATKEIRAIGVKSLIVGLTAACDESEIQTFKAAGLDDCFNQPLSIEMIEKVLKQLNK